MKKMILTAIVLTIAACGTAYENADLEGCKGSINNKDVVANNIIVKQGYAYRYSLEKACIEFAGEIENGADWHEKEQILICYQDGGQGAFNLPGDPEEAKCSTTLATATFCDGAENTPVYRCSAPDITAADLGW